MTAEPLSLAPDPDADCYAALGVDDPELGRLLHVAFSRVLGEASGSRSFTRGIVVALAGIGRLSYRRKDGTVVPALAPELPERGWSRGDHVLKRLGVNPAEIDRRWSIAQATDGLHAQLDLALLQALFPPCIWPIAAELVRIGPGEACERLERFCRLEAQRTIKPTVARPTGGTLSAGTIDNLLTNGRRLFAALCDLNRRDYPSPYVEPWAALPATPAATGLGAADVDTDRTAPPLLLVRRVLRALDDDVARRKRNARLRRALARPLRNRALLAVVVCTGARASAIAAASVGDYEPEHRFPAGEVGPALRIYPGKGRAPSVAAWKALPLLVATWLDEHLDYAGLSGEPAPLWPAVKRGHADRMSANSISRVFAGNRSSPRGRAMKPLLPRLDAADVGYSAHTLRHLAEQLAYEAGHDYIQEHADARAMVTPQVFADALLDHAMSSDRLGYKDLKTSEGRERWGRVAGLGIWEYVWGDRGARKAPDVDRIRRARDELAELEAETAAIQERIDEFRGRRRALEQRGLDEARPLSSDELVPLLFHLSAIAGGLDDEHSELERVQASRLRSELELHEARTTLVPIPDDAPEPVLDEELRVPAAGDVEEEPEPVRDWLTPAEAAHAFGVSGPTMRRWFRGELPHAEGDPRNPWQPSKIHDVIERISDRKQRLIVSRLDRSRIAPEVMRAIKAMLCQPPMS